MSETENKCPCGSGIPFAKCHGLNTPLVGAAAAVAGNPSEPAFVIAPAPVTRKLDLACGQTPAPGFVGVDFYAPGAQHKVDLRVYPWPFADSSVAVIRSSHYIEHIEMVEVMHNGRMKDAFCAFMDECHRVLVPDGWLELMWPFHRSDRAFWDPTHRRFIPSQTVLYFNRAWREFQKLDHYAIDSDYGVWFPDKPGHGVDVVPIVAEELTKLHPEVAMRRLNAEWNVGIDWHAKMQAKKA